MIVVSGSITIDPSKTDRMVELTATLVPATRAESGNLDYVFSQAPETGVWRVFEEWESEDALNSHFATPHMTEFMGAMGEVGVSAVDIHRYDVTAKSKLM